MSSLRLLDRHHILAEGSVQLGPLKKRGWAVGSNGTLRAFHFADAKTGCAIGSKGVILITANGDSTWQSRKSNVKYNLNNVFFVTTKEGSRGGRLRVAVAHDQRQFDLGTGGTQYSRQSLAAVFHRAQLRLGGRRERRNLQILGKLTFNSATFGGNQRREDKRNVGDLRISALGGEVVAEEDHSSDRDCSQGHISARIV